MWQSALAATHYVDLNSTNATPPYTDWATAATNIQDAVDAAVAGDEVVVTNGAYAGGTDINKPLTVRSVNGPQSTIIDGGGSIPCAHLADGARLLGFTLTNGFGARLLVGGYFRYVGGGVWGQSSNAVVSNCVITGNRIFSRMYTASVLGGGAYGVTLNNCSLTSNSVSAIVDTTCAHQITAGGGGAAYCTLNNCTLSGNSFNITNFVPSLAWTVEADGGGAYSCTLNNCAVSGNSVFATRGAGGYYPGGYGGGAAYCTANNCTLCANSVGTGCGFNCSWVAYDGGAHSCTLNNCIIFRNYEGYAGQVCEDCYFPAGLDGNNWRGDPLFVDTNGWANLRLQSNSPCINAGSNSYVTNAADLDGNPRIVGGTVDIGAYEFQAPVSQISYAWLQQYGLPINAATDTADPDGDAVDNYHEWLAGTDPTNRFSSPARLTITPSGLPPSGIILTWSTNAVGFTLQSTTELGASNWSTNLPAPVVVGNQNVVTNPISGPQQFYRLAH